MAGGVVHVAGVRAPRVELPDGARPVWNPRLLELSHAANAVSLMMPHVEPYFVRTVRAALPQLDDDLRPAAERFAQEEAAHHAAHRHFDLVLRAAYPRTRHLDRLVGRTCGWLSRTRSLRFNLAFAAASETMAFALARWADPHLPNMQRGATPEVAELFLWHLAEEVAHKEVAFDVWEAIDGSRWRYARAMCLAVFLLASFTAIGTLLMLGKDRALWKPTTWLRLARWTISCVFGALPTLFVSALPSHHPSQLTDPDGYRQWVVERSIEAAAS
jgi:uncharacterized protein